MSPRRQVAFVVGDGPHRSRRVASGTVVGGQRPHMLRAKAQSNPLALLPEPGRHLRRRPRGGTPLQRRQAVRLRSRAERAFSSQVKPVERTEGPAIGRIHVLWLLTRGPGSTATPRHSASTPCRKPRPTPCSIWLAPLRTPRSAWPRRCRAGWPPRPVGPRRRPSPWLGTWPNLFAPTERCGDRRQRTHWPTSQGRAVSSKCLPAGTLSMPSSARRSSAYDEPAPAGSTLTGTAE